MAAKKTTAAKKRVRSNKASGLDHVVSMPQAAATAQDGSAAPVEEIIDRCYDVVVGTVPPDRWGFKSVDEAEAVLGGPMGPDGRAALARAHAGRAAPGTAPTTPADYAAGMEALAAAPATRTIARGTITVPADGSGLDPVGPDLFDDEPVEEAPAAPATTPPRPASVAPPEPSAAPTTAAKTREARSQEIRNWTTDAMHAHYRSLRGRDFDPRPELIKQLVNVAKGDRPKVEVRKELDAKSTVKLMAQFKTLRGRDFNERPELTWQILQAEIAKGLTLPGQGSRAAGGSGTPGPRVGRSPQALAATRLSRAADGLEQAIAGCDWDAMTGVPAGSAGMMVGSLVSIRSVIAAVQASAQPTVPPASGVTQPRPPRKVREAKAPAVAGAKADIASGHVGDYQDALRPEQMIGLTVVRIVRTDAVCKTADGEEVHVKRAHLVRAA